MANNKIATNEPFSQNNFSGGIQPYPKTSTIPNGFYFGRSINYRDDPQAITLQPGAVKESGSVVTDLIKWGDLLPSTFDSYFYGDTGNIYNRDDTGSWSNIHKAASSHGNGLAYFFADDFLYYACDSTIGRYGPVSGSNPQFSDDFMAAQGGIPLNTASLVLASASSQYATAADSASLSITGDLTLEGYIKSTSLPAVGSSMTLIGKWDESGATRSYKLDLYGVSGYFGDGSDGALTISTDTTESPVDSACTGTAGLQSLSATNASFAQGQVIFIHQSQGTNAGQWERQTIQGYTAGTITTGQPLKNTYTTGAQVRVLKQYTNVTINSGKTWTCKAWNGTVGGILSFLANGTVTVTGTISAKGGNGEDGGNTDTGPQASGGTGGGFRGGNSRSGGGSQLTAQCGEGTTGDRNYQGEANGNGGGGGTPGGGCIGDTGGGGGHATAGDNGQGDGPTVGQTSHHGPGAGGNTVSDTADLTTMVFGGGGGGSAEDGKSAAGGGAGGGIIFINGTTVTVTGSITANGGNGGSGSSAPYVIGAGGAGGSILIKVQTATLGTALITATGGEAGTGGYGGGGAGGNGRIHLDYYTSYTGTTSPTLNATQDNTLVTTVTIQARLGISSNGTAYEYLTQNLNNYATVIWNRISVSWTAATSTAIFYVNGLAIGTSVGTKTSISDNASLLYIGANKGASTVGNFFNGKFNDFRIWNNVQTAAQIYANNQIQVPTNSIGLKAYYTFNSVYTDGTVNANTLTAVNTPTFDTSDVPFPAATTRLDIDQSFTTTGQTYTLTTAISEAAADLLSFTPSNDPQKSVDFNIDTVGTGNWTVTVHDQQNRVIATKTILNASLHTGYVEFTFATPWRIVIGKTYHMHLISTVADGKVITSVASNFSNADFHTYFAYLVTDTAYHPVFPFLDFLAIGNERYVAMWDGAFYYPNYIAFPTGWRVRSISTWREFLAIGVWRGPTITSYTHGRVYFWDGIAPTFNFFIDIPDGQVNALWGRDSDLFIVAGYRGDLLDYQGSFFFDTGNSSSNKIRFLPKRSPSGYVEVYPGAMNYWRNLLQIGFAGAATMTTIEKGVYSYGTYDPQMPNTVSFDYPISTGNRGSTVEIGCVYPIGDKLIIGWQDGSGYGADVVSYDNAPAPSGRIELMIDDDNAIWHYKTEYQIRADFLPLKTGESVDIQLNEERQGWNLTTTPDSTVGDTFTKMMTTPGREREMQFAVDLYATGSTSPTLLGISALESDLKEEQQF